jgi:hypothetical protein
VISDAESPTFDEARAAMAAVLDGQLHPSVLLPGDGVEQLAGFAAALRERCARTPVAADRPVVWCAEDVPGDVSVAAAAVVASAGAAAALAGVGPFRTAAFCPAWENVRQVLGSSPVEKLLAPPSATAHVIGVGTDQSAERVARALCRLDARRALVLAPTHAIELCDGSIHELDLPDADATALVAGLRLYAVWLAPTPAIGVARARATLDAGATPLRPAA